MEWLRNQTRKLVTSHPTNKTTNSKSLSGTKFPDDEILPKNSDNSDSFSDSTHSASSSSNSLLRVSPLTRRPSSATLISPVIQTNLWKELEDFDLEFDSPQIREILKQEREEFKKVIGEYSRKIQVLTSALEEKAEHTVELAHQTRTDEMVIKELSQTITSQETEKERLLRENAVKDVIMNELNRRIETITRSLEVLAVENVELQALIPLDEGDNVRAVFEEMGMEEPHMDPGTVQLLSAKIEELEYKIKQIQSQLQQQEKKQYTSQQMINGYEKKIRKLNDKMNQSMTKEAEKRKICEKEAKSLTKKVQELELVLGEREDENSSTSVDSNEENDSDQEDQPLFIVENYQKEKF